MTPPAPLLTGAGDILTSEDNHLEGEMPQKIELDNQLLYDVEVVLNDGSTLNCTLLDKPSIAALIAVAASLGLSDDFAKILAVSDEIKAEDYTAEIKVADVVLATVAVKPGVVFTVKRKARKPRSDKGSTRKPKADDKLTADEACAAFE